MNYLTVFFFTTFVSGLLAQSPLSVKQFNWLEGTWKQEGKDAHEQWEVVSDSLIRGASFYKNGNDYKRGENIEFLLKDSSFHYAPLVFGQNNNQPVDFKVTSFTPVSFIAENPAHDFPKVISYRLTDNSHMAVYLEGNNRRIDFLFVRE